MRVALLEDQAFLLPLNVGIEQVALHAFDATRPILPWLMRICTNCCVDIMRSKGRTDERLDTYEFALADNGPGALDVVERRDIGDQIFRAIDRLPDRYRKIIMMRHYRHMDVAEIADALSKPEGTVKSWLFRARALLRKDLGAAAV